MRIFRPGPDLFRGMPGVARLVVGAAALAALAVVVVFIAALAPRPAAALDADAIVRAAHNHFRGQSSVAMIVMAIHRPDWKRTMRMRAWTGGRDRSLVRILEPAKDRYNATLKKGREMWTYNPKVNRVIKLPPSMMSQAWMGSDFSNNDLARSDSITADYDHYLEKTVSHEGKKLFVIKSTPKPGAPVVWGMQRLHVREDNLLLKELFYDEEHRLVKTMSGADIRRADDRMLPMRWEVRKADANDEYTRLQYVKIEFNMDLPGSLFTVRTLRNPGR